MSDLSIETRVQALLEQNFAQPGNEHLFCVEISYQPAKKKLEVFVDSDQGLDLEACAQLNRFLQGVIDEQGWLGETYVLDVSSPGLSRPLSGFRQYRKNIGRELKLKTRAGTVLQGKLEAVSEGGISLSFSVTEKQGKKNVRIDKREDIPFADIKEAKVQVSFD